MDMSDIISWISWLMNLLVPTPSLSSYNLVRKFTYVNVVKGPVHYVLLHASTKVRPAY